MGRYQDWVIDSSSANGTFAKDTTTKRKPRLLEVKPRKQCCSQLPGEILYDDVEAYILDNSKLKSSSTGVRWRRSTNLDDVITNKRIALFGKKFTGTVVGNFLKVREGLYLPMFLHGEQVLIPARIDPDDMETDSQSTDRCQQYSDVGPPKASRGALYQVVYDGAIAMRLFPSVGAPICGRREEGDTIELFDWDDTLKWRKFYDEKTEDAGWMLLDDAHFGPLLRPHGLLFSVRPLVPLCVAAWENNLDDVQRIVADCANVNARNPGGETPMMLAAREGHADCAAVLLLADADPLLPDADGRNPLEIAKSNGMRHLIRAFLRHGSARLQTGSAVKDLEVGLRTLKNDRIRELVTARLQNDEPRNRSAGACCNRQPQVPEPIEAVKQHLNESSLSPRTLPRNRSAEACSNRQPQKPEIFETVQQPGVTSSSPRKLCDNLQTKGGYVVVFNKPVAVRVSPDLESPVCGRKDPGDTLELGDWDATCKWRRLHDPCSEDSGWMLLDSPEFGPLLRPSWASTNAATPLPPICVAAAENNVVDLAAFLDSNADPLAHGPDGRNPFMIAASAEHYNCAALLLVAMSRSQETHRGTDSIHSLDFALAEPMQNLIAAFKAEHYNADLLEDVMEVVLSEVKPVVYMCIDEAQRHVQACLDEVQNSGMYIILPDSVPLHPGPSAGCAPLSYLLHGDCIELFEWDDMVQWRRARGTESHKEGWVNLGCHEVGPVVRPVGADRLWKPLDPLCMATLENNIHDVQWLLDLGIQPAATDHEGLTPLVRAARSGYYNCAVCLLNASLNMLEEESMALYAVDIAPDAAMRNMLGALIGNDFQEEEYQRARSALKPEVLEIADELYRTARQNLGKLD